jgi:phospholipid/cholesterol/gamma-HCH transport system substrate-binding protein
MSTLGSSGRVGVTVVIAGALLTGMYVFFQGLGNSYTIDVLFPNASGAVATMPVQIAGVKVGEVGDVNLSPDRQADVQLKIRNQYKIPIGSHFRIITPLLGGVGAVAIIPPALDASNSTGSIAEGQKVIGDPSFDFSGAIGKSGELIQTLTRTAKKTELVVDDLQGLIGDPRLKGSLMMSAQNITMASQNSVKLTQHLDSDLAQDNGALVALLADTSKSAHHSLGNIDATTDQIKDMTVADKSRLDEILSNLQDTTSAVAGITTETNESFKSGHVADNISATVANLKTSTDHLNQIAANLEKLTGDSATNADLKATIHNIRETTAQSAFLLNRLNKLAGNKHVPPVDINDEPPVQGSTGGVTSTAVDVTPPKGGKSASFTLSPRVDLLQNTAQDHFRADANVIVGTGGPGHPFGELGVYGLGDNSGLNLQCGKGYGSGLDYRGGLYNSKLGVGADYGLGSDVSFSLNVYNPNHYMVDAQSVVMINKNLGLVIGADDITRQAGGSLGIELRR